MLVLSVGPELHSGNGTALLPMPWALVEHLPILANALPARLDAYVYLCAAALTGITIDEARRWLAANQVGIAIPVAGAVVAMAAVAALFPMPLSDMEVRVPRYFTDGAAASIPEGALVLTVPSIRTGATTAMLWQAASRMRYRTTGGFWEYQPADPSPVTDWLDGRSTRRSAHEALEREEPESSSSAGRPDVDGTG